MRERAPCRSKKRTTLTTFDLCQQLGDLEKATCVCSHLGHSTNGSIGREEVEVFAKSLTLMARERRGVFLGRWGGGATHGANTRLTCLSIPLNG